MRGATGPHHLHHPHPGPTAGPAAVAKSFVEAVVPADNAVVAVVADVVAVGERAGGGAGRRPGTAAVGAFVAVVA